MKNLRNNRIILGTFAVLMAIGLMAAYVPMIFPPTPVPAEYPTEDYGAQLPASAEFATTTPTSTVPAKASLPDSFSGLQDEQNSLNDLGDLLND
jgi:hypothetical protein